MVLTDSPDKLDDDNALEKFKKDLVGCDGRYQVRWPWKEEKSNTDCALAV